MSERGVFAVDRGIWDHPMFESRAPLSKREAWLWLVSEASWKARTVRMEGRAINLARGQIVHSVRFIADKWGWPKSNVARFLDALKTETMIGTESGTGLTVITICKYDEYQRVSLPDRDSSGTPLGTAAGQQRDKVEDIEGIESPVLRTDAGASPEMALDLTPLKPAEPTFTDSKHELWAEGPAILETLGVRQRTSRPVIGRWMKAAKDDAVTVLGAIQRARDLRVQDPVSWITRAISTGPPRQQHQSIYEITAELKNGRDHDQRPDDEAEFEFPSIAAARAGP